MKAIRGNALVATTLFGLLMVQSNQQVGAQESKIHPISNQMVAAIIKAPDAKAAKEALCGQGGLIRGSGSTAGGRCILQDFAAVAILSCHDYVNGRDAFKDSKCAQNSRKVGIDDLQRAAVTLKSGVQADVPYLTNTKLLICGPESLGAGLASYRNKLPAELKKIADVACGSKPVEGPLNRKRANAVAQETPGILSIRKKLKTAAEQNAVYLEDIVTKLQTPKGLASAGKVTIGGQALGVKAVTITGTNNSQATATLLQVAQQLTRDMKNLNKVLDNDANFAPQEEDVKETLNFEDNLEREITLDELFDILTSIREESNAQFHRANR